MNKYDVTVMINGYEITTRVFASNENDACFRVALQISPDAEAEFRNVQTISS